LIWLFVWLCLPSLQDIFTQAKKLCQPVKTWGSLVLDYLGNRLAASLNFNGVDFFVVHSGIFSLVMVLQCP
jgi:hypothetical protein